MNVFGDYDRKDDRAANTQAQNEAQMQNHVPTSNYDPYHAYYAPQPPKREKKRGIGGVVVACTLSAALIGGTLGGLGGMALGYNMNAQEPQTEYARTIEQLQQTVDELTDKMTAAQAQNSGASAIAVSSQGSGMTVAEIAKKVSPSVVAINTTVISQQQSFFGTYESEGEGSGSGVIISEDGYIVSNNHVVADANSITVVLQDGTEYEAKLIGRDSKTDIAIIKIEAEGLPAVEIGDSSALEVGDTVIAIGNPLGELAGSVTQGILSAREREITIDNETMNLLQVDAAVNRGNSGGALVNSGGQLVGIVNAKSSGYDVEGIGFAIPINDVQNVIDDIVSVGYVTGRPKVGISTRDVTEEISKAYRMPVGAYVSEIEEFSAAERAGLKVGDVIVKFDGQDITSGTQITQIRDQHEVGDAIEMEVVREGQQMTLELILMEDVSGS